MEEEDLVKRATEKPSFRRGLGSRHQFEEFRLRKLEKTVVLVFVLCSRTCVSPSDQVIDAIHVSQ